MDNRIKIAVAAVVIVAAFWAYQTFGTATVAITSEPSGAVVRVDGRQRGITPIERLELDTGSHRLEVAHSHYATYVEGLSLRRGDHLQRAVKLEVGEGTYEFLSNPRGAWVEVDGERVGRTPMKYTTASGPHVIGMGQEERYIVEETHTVKDGQTLEVNFNLNIDPHGSVTFTTFPRSAKVEFIGEDIVYKPKVRVQIGEYAIRVSAPGYVSQEFRYQVRYGNNLHEVNLQRDFGTLHVTVTPADAEVQVSYNEGGQTRRQTYRQAIQVPVGKVEVRARALGYRTSFRSIRLGNKGATVRFNLEQMSVRPGQVIRDVLRGGGQGPEVVVIPAGQFQMGDANGPPSEQPVRTVTLTQPFAVARYETTVGEYLKFAQAVGRRVHELINVDAPEVAMTHVSVQDATAYAEWLSVQTGQKYRLLSEAEWEYVARAGTSGPYFFGDNPLDLCTYANVADRSTRKRYRDWDTLNCDDGIQRLGAVGTLQPNPFGLYDIYGNVAEWVADCGMPDYARAPSDGSAASEGIGCTSNGIRGGSWDSMATEATSTYRLTGANANDDRGIRLLREL